MILKISLVYYSDSNEWKFNSKSIIFVFYMNLFVSVLNTATLSTCGDFYSWSLHHAVQIDNG